MLSGKDWAGGMYYLVNLINSLSLLNEDQRPVVYLFYYNDLPEELIKSIDYPDIKYVNTRPLSNFIRGVNWLQRKLTGRNKWLEHLISSYDLKGIYPLTEFRKDWRLSCKAVFWVYDLQHEYYPDFFNIEEVERRKRQFSEIAAKAEVVVFSSKDSMERFKSIYKPVGQLKLLRFASMINPDHVLTDESALVKYNIKKPYFIISNQFWKHKNHLVAFKALRLIIDSGINATLVCTGKMQDNRNEEYFPELLNEVKRLDLGNNIFFTGFIPRSDQLSLMKGSLAVIQPSLFEGWSTVVEDAKALKKRVLASDIPIHREQLEELGFYFNPLNPKELADHMMALNSGKPKFAQVVDYEYLYNQQVFAKDFINLFYS